MLALKLVIIIVVLTVEIAVQAAVATPAHAFFVHFIVIAIQILMEVLVFVIKLIMTSVMPAFFIIVAFVITVAFACRQQRSQTDNHSGTDKDCASTSAVSMTVVAFFCLSGHRDNYQSCSSSSSAKQAFGPSIHFQSPCSTQIFLVCGDKLAETNDRMLVWLVSCRSSKLSCTSSDVLRQVGSGFSGELASSGADI